MCNDWCMTMFDPSNVPPHQLLTCDDASTYSTLPVRTIRHLFDTRAVPLVKVTRRLYVRAEDLDAYLEAQTIPARGEQ